MRSIILLSALAGFAAASPVANPIPQGIDFDAYDSGVAPVAQGPPTGVTEQPATYNPAAAAASASVAATTDPVSTDGLSRRRARYDHAVRDVNAPCGLQPPGSGVVSNPDTPAGFLADPDYTAIATNAPTPQGYTLNFVNAQASISQNGYMGLYTLTSFDTIKCQELCDAAPACTAFNIYIERDPSVNPADGCSNPSSTINYKCTLYGLPISILTATNTGQGRDQFTVVITGSNGYSKLAPPPSYPNFSGPVELGGAINAPSNYMGSKYYPGPYDPSQCASSCQATTAYDHRHPSSTGTYDACNFFNSYVLSIDNVPQGTYCAMYTRSWDKSYSTNYGQYRGSDLYSVSQSYAYTLTPQDPGHI